MNRLALIRGQNIVEKTVRFLSKKTIQSMDRLVIIQDQKFVETAVTSSKKKRSHLWRD